MEYLVFLSFIALITSVYNVCSPACTGSLVCTSLGCKNPNDGVQTCPNGITDCAAQGAGATCNAGKCDCLTYYMWSYYYYDCLIQHVAGSPNCGTQADCLDHSTTRARCQGNHCQCINPFNWASANRGCGKPNSGGGSDCASSLECLDNVNGFCDTGNSPSKCRCNTGLPILCSRSNL